MKALCYPEYGQLVVDEVRPPTCGPNEVIISVAACGICGSELETFKNRSPRREPPLVMGHEFCGTITDVGSDVTEWSLGDRVVSNSVVACRDCVRCRRGDSHLCASRQIFGMHRAGAFAEEVAVPSQCLVPWPEGLQPEVACLAEPLANGIHVNNLTRHIDGSNILVLGAGPIGLMVLQAFHNLRSSTVWVGEINKDRLIAARECGADKCVDVSCEDILAMLKEETNGEGADIVVDAVGSSSTNRLALDAARPGGCVVIVGLHENTSSLSSYDITLPEKQILGSYAATMEELTQAVSLLASGVIKTTPFVQKFDLSDGVSAFNRMIEANGRDIKAVLIP